MKRFLRFMTLALIAALIPGCGAGVSEGGQVVQLFAATVGKGDALIVAVDGWACLIDTGKPYMAGMVRTALKAMGVSRLDAVFLTHTDKDHAGGLRWLAESDIPVGAWYAPAMFTGVKRSKHPMVTAAELRGEDVQWLERGDEIALGDTGAALRVLAPASLYEDTDDNNSLVMMLETDQGRMLLTGDMELSEEMELLAQGDDLNCAVLKVPHHGQDKATSQALVNACRPQVAVISTDSREKPGTPDPGVLSRLRAAGAQTCVTQDVTLGLKVTLSGGRASVEAMNLDTPYEGGVAITRVVPGDDLITLANQGGDRDMTGWYLYSDRGDELFAFPDGYTLPAGRSITVGTLSSDGEFDLLWHDKKVVHKSKIDNIILYDPCARVVDSMDNGE